MRTLPALLLASSLIASRLQGTPAIEPWIVSDQLAELPHELSVDRGSAHLLMRMKAPEVERQLLSHLRHEADVTRLDRPLALHPAGLGKIVVDGATSLRFRISGATEGTVLLVAGEDGAFERFEPSHFATWTPTTQGPAAYVRVEQGGDTMSIEQLAIGTTQTNGSASACTKDVACTNANDDPEVTAASRAIALIRFVRGNASYVCTGGLVNDAHNSGTPYFLTARHCISTQEEAASIEAVWDDRAAVCGVAGNPSQIKRTYGAELLVASADTDVALLRLKNIPSNRVFLGVERSPLADGTAVYRVSHAEGKPQKYSAGKVRTKGAGCPAAPRPRFLYTTPTEGAVAVGSSGAPLLVSGLRIAGQLFALCGPSPNEPCAIYNEVVDGAIAASWPLLAPHLEAAPVESPTTAVPPPARRRSARH